MVNVPCAAAVTSTVIVQLAPAGTVPPVRAMLSEPGSATTVPPQLASRSFGDATLRPEGRVAASIRRPVEHHGVLRRVADQ